MAGKPNPSMHDEQRDAETLSTAVRLMVGQFARRLRSEAEAADHSPLQEAVVYRLGHTAGLSGADLARLEGVRPQSMSLTLQTLERAGLIQGAPDPTDGRRTLLNLTEAGHTALSTALTRKQTWLVGALLNELTSDERQALHRSLELLTRLLRR